MASFDDSYPKNMTTVVNSSLKCEKELIPVLAGECRANPMTIPFEKSLIRSASAEVNKTTTEFLIFASSFVCFCFFVIRIPRIDKGNQMNMQNLDVEDH